MHKSNFQLIILLFSVLVYCYFNLQSQNIGPINDKKIHQYIIENGMSLIGKPYKAGTLESEGPEKLTFFEDAFDCVTFVEYVLAKSLSKLYPGEKGFEAFLQDLRYRDGIIDGYGSRLHYFTEWILENSTKGRCVNATAEIGSRPYKKKINFITKNKTKYPKLKDSLTMRLILTSEKRINNAIWYDIPKLEIPKVQKKIHNGDVIAITTSISGLDIVHTGFAVWQKDKLYLLHASEKEKKVVLTKISLAQYLQSNKNQSGIMVVRFLGNN